MEEPLLANQCSLNSNIAKELIWRRNAPYFYQMLYTQELEWPSLTIEWWVPNQNQQKTNHQEQFQLCSLTYGTHTSGEDKNYLIMAKVYIPNQHYLRKTYKDKPLKATEAIRKNDNCMEDKIIVQHQIEHDGEVNRIRHHPTKTNLIATRTPAGQIHIFDKMKFKTGKVKINPSYILAGHRSEGYSLQWNPHNQGQIVAGSYDGKLTLWDINSRQENGEIHPLSSFIFHDKQIEDVSFHKFHDYIFASCDDQGQTAIWDTRNPNQPVIHNKCDNQPLYSLEFGPLDRHIFATAGSSRLIKLWDVRNLSQSLFEFKQEVESDITQIKWSPKDRQTLWSTCGNTLSMWDLSQGKKQFVHAGHLKNINQMDIHPFQTDTIASVDSNNDIHVFQPTKNSKS